MDSQLEQIEKVIKNVFETSRNDVVDRCCRLFLDEIKKIKSRTVEPDTYKYSGQELSDQIQALIEASGFKMNRFTSNYTDDSIWIRTLEAEREQTPKQASDNDDCCHYGSHNNAVSND